MCPSTLNLKFKSIFLEADDFSPTTTEREITTLATTGIVINHKWKQGLKLPQTKKRVEWENKIWIFTKIEKEERGRNR